ncbi:MAG: BON domain-containing protein [Armatimonadota bacterium]
MIARERALTMAVGDRLKAEEIKAVLIANEMEGLSEIDVNVHGGVVVLEGDVDTEEQKLLAEQLVYEEDIKGVINNIRVVPRVPGKASAYDGFDARLGFGPAEGDAGDIAFSLSAADNVPGPGAPTSEQFPGQFSDDEIESQIEREFQTQSEVDISNVEFNSENQIVNLEGSVETADDLNSIQEMILRMRGVLGINSKLRIKQGDTGTPVE